ncbi:hypothetical protein POVCU2_0078440 [Plasmodium ovale curtisi]|uniref:PIR Superfamily Protein n=1 Tax=Plasmodium ovale curtisi TaxID=864141 RepID=A0A1A8WME6_PLAOA|nr:hypothetical protein POVCU2_0078440 [Plasmodium ovale curtisi]SBT01338.1 hypothetical protein POVCU1_066180 [Plasmodium ovale curtisi]
MNGIKEDNLPSNDFVSKLCGGIEIENFENFCKNANGYTNGYDWISLFNSSLSNIFFANKSHFKSVSYYKCCRNLNYYLYLVLAVIKSSNISEQEHGELIELIDVYWKGMFQHNHLHGCKRQENTYSIEKRCILTQLYDYSDDQSYLLTTNENEEQRINEYNKCKEKKWNQIKNYTPLNNEDFFIILK